MAITTNKHKDNNYILSILISQDGLSFCTATAGENKKIIAYEYKKINSSASPITILESLQPEVQKLQQTYQLSKVIVVYANTLYTLVPNDFFDENKLSQYLKFNIKILETDYITYDDIPYLATKNVFIPLTNINNYLFDTFGSFTFTHSVSLLINSVQQQLLEATTQGFIQVYPTHFDLSIFSDKKLILANSFSYYTPEDFIYYLLFSLEQLSIKPTEIKLYLGGDINTGTAVYNYIETYIKHVYFFTKEENINNNLIDNENALINKDYHTNHLILKSLFCE